MLNTVINGDCLEVMKEIASGSVDMILCDLPYGTTACKWDAIILFEPLWEQYKRLIKPSGAIVLTASQPFTSLLVASNLKMFKYCWVWEKDNGKNFLNARNQPLKVHEDICVFSFYAASPHRRVMEYFPQYLEGKPYSIKGGGNNRSDQQGGGEFKRAAYSAKTTRSPRSVIKFHGESGLHPTQKPVALFEYLIKTYTNEGETVLDNCLGSGTTAIACINTGRNWIGIEKDQGYYEVACKRIADHLESIKQAS